MEDNKMLDKLTEIIREHTGEDSITLDENTILIADLGLSSLDLVNLICAVEDEFNIEIPDRSISTFKTVGDVIAFIQKTIS